MGGPTLSPDSSASRAVIPFTEGRRSRHETWYSKLWPQKWRSSTGFRGTRPAKRQGQGLEPTNIGGVGYAYEGNGRLNGERQKYENRKDAEEKLFRWVRQKGKEDCEGLADYYDKHSGESVLSAKRDGRLMNASNPKYEDGIGMWTQRSPGRCQAQYAFGTNTWQTDGHTQRISETPGATKACCNVHNTARAINIIKNLQETQEHPGLRPMKDFDKIIDRQIEALGGDDVMCCDLRNKDSLNRNCDTWANRYLGFAARGVGWRDGAHYLAKSWEIPDPNAKLYENRDICNKATAASCTDCSNPTKMECTEEGAKENECFLEGNRKKGDDYYFHPYRRGMPPFSPRVLRRSRAVLRPVAGIFTVGGLALGGKELLQVNTIAAGMKLFGEFSLKPAAIIGLKKGEDYAKTEAIKAVAQRLLELSHTWLRLFQDSLRSFPGATKILGPKSVDVYDKALVDKLKEIRQTLEHPESQVSENVKEQAKVLSKKLNGYAEAILKFLGHLSPVDLESLSRMMQQVPQIPQTLGGMVAVDHGRQNPRRKQLNPWNNPVQLQRHSPPDAIEMKMRKNIQTEYLVPDDDEHDEHRYRGLDKPRYEVV